METDKKSLEEEWLRMWLSILQERKRQKTGLIDSYEPKPVSWPPHPQVSDGTLDF